MLLTGLVCLSDFMRCAIYRHFLGNFISNVWQAYQTAYKRKYISKLPFFMMTIVIQKYLLFIKSPMLCPTATSFYFNYNFNEPFLCNTLFFIPS